MFSNAQSASRNLYPKISGIRKPIGSYQSSDIYQEFITLALKLSKLENNFPSNKFLLYPFSSISELYLTLNLKQVQRARVFPVNHSSLKLLGTDGTGRDFRAKTTKWNYQLSS